MFNKYSALRDLFKLVKGNHQKWLIIAVTISTLTVLASSSLMAYSAFIISFSALQPSIAEILVPVTAVRFLGLSRAILRYSERLLSHNTIFLYLSRLRVKIYEGVSRMSGEQLLRLKKSDMLNVLTSDIETLQDVFLRGLLPLFSSLLLFVMVSIALVNLNSNIAILFVIFYPIATFGMALFSRKLTLGKSRNQIEAIGDYKVSLMAFTDELSELNWNGRTLEYERALENRADYLEKATENISFGKIMASQGQQLVVNLNVLFALIVGVILVKNGELSGIYLAVCTLVIFTFYESAPAFLTLFQKLEAGEYSAQRLLEPLTDKKVPQQNSEQLNANESELSAIKKDSVIKDRSIPSIAPVLSYQDLNFKYEGSNVALSGINLILKPNKKMAIVGASGSGKSTIAALLCGLLSPHNGTITCDDQLIDLHEAEGLMSYFSVVNQEVYLFHQRVLDNLRLANSEMSAEEISAALVFSGLSDWVESGWIRTNPWIGEDGMILSGGMRQRFGLARALLRKAPYLILDEAFAGLDIGTESEILNRLLSLEDQGIIWITHRLVQMEMMDEIIVMENGKMIATGKHDDLLESCEAYRMAYLMD